MSFAPDSYNVNDSFVELRMDFQGNKWHANDTNDIPNVAISFVQILGIPKQSLQEMSIGKDTYQDLVRHMTITTTHVYLGGKLANLIVYGSNLVELTFTNLTLTHLSSYGFYTSPTLSPISSDRAIEISRVFLTENLPISGNWSISSPEQLGYGLDQEHLTIASLVHWDLSVIPSDGQIHTALALVDAQFGTPLSYRFGSAWTDFRQFYPMGSSDLSGLFFIMALVASCIIVGIFVVEWPPEFLFTLSLSLYLLLYTRLRKENILDNYSRGIVYGFVQAKPGASFSDIKKGLSLANGQVMYHLTVLEKNGLIINRRAGNLVRYYPSDIKNIDIELTWTKLQQDIVRFLNQQGGFSASQIAKKLLNSRQTIRYNLRKLISDGAIQSNFRNGRRYFSATRIYDLPIKEENQDNEPKSHND